MYLPVSLAVLTQQPVIPLTHPIQQVLLLRQATSLRLLGLLKLCKSLLQLHSLVLKPRHSVIFDLDCAKVVVLRELRRLNHLFMLLCSE